MKNIIMFSAGLVLTGVCGLVRPVPSMAGAPTEQIRMTVDRVVSILQDPRYSGNAKEPERREQLRRAIYPRFDFEEMAKRSLGSHWRRRTPKEQAEFVALFTNLIKDSYVISIESYRSDKVLYTREVQEGNYAEVGTVIITNKGEEFSIAYRLHLVNRNWKVYDVVIENISIVNNYRSQFGRVIARSSYGELIRVMKDKQS